MIFKYDVVLDPDFRGNNNGPYTNFNWIVSYEDLLESIYALNWEMTRNETYSSNDTTVSDVCGMCDDIIKLATEFKSKFFPK